MNLQEIRKSVDDVDNEIVRLYKKRMSLCDEIGEYKKKNNMPIYDPVREKEKLKILCSLADDNSDRQEIEELFSHIMLMSRKRQAFISGED